MSEPVKPKARRGFAAMDPALRKKIAARGGKKSQREGVGYRWRTSEEAREARNRRKIDNKPTDDEEARDSVA